MPMRQVDISAEQPKPMVMHWAINDWNLSPESCRPTGTQQIDDKAVQTPFQDGKSIHLSFPEAQCPSRCCIASSVCTTQAMLNALLPYIAGFVLEILNAYATLVVCFWLRCVIQSACHNVILDAGQGGHEQAACWLAAHPLNCTASC